MSTAYLQTALNVDTNSWVAARGAFKDAVEPIGHVDSK
jgi:hypothetical protein